MIEFDMRAAAITTIDRHLAETKDLVMQAAQRRSVNDNARDDECRSEMEEALVSHGVLSPGTRLLVSR